VKKTEKRIINLFLAMIIIAFVAIGYFAVSPETPSRIIIVDEATRTQVDLFEFEHQNKRIEEVTDPPESIKNKTFQNGALFNFFSAPLFFLKIQSS